MLQFEIEVEMNTHGREVVELAAFLDEEVRGKRHFAPLCPSRKTSNRFLV
jgi:hypothetical protein